MLYHSVDYSFYLKTGFLGKPCYVKRIVEALSKKKAKTRIYKDELSRLKTGLISHYRHCTGGFTKRVREMSYQLFVTLYTLSIYPYAHQQLRRHRPKPFRECPCT